MKPSDGDLFVSPAGNDEWSGRLCEANANNTDGPLASIERARDIIREEKSESPRTVWIRGGRYELRAPLLFKPEDSGDTTYAAFPGEQPVLDGGERITGWRAEKLNGRDVFVTELPGERSFRQLFVNGRRAIRARLPKLSSDRTRQEFFRMESVPGLSLNDFWLHDGKDAFIAREGEFESRTNLQDVEVVAFHFWVDERMPVKSFDPAQRLVKSARRSILALVEDWDAGTWPPYYVDNVFEALSDPGEWYLDREKGRLYYLPREGETAETITAMAPRVQQLLRLEGEPEAGRFVEGLKFRGLTFEHADWQQGHGGVANANDPDTGEDYAAYGQAAHGLPGAIQFIGARGCAFENCTVRHVGMYAVDLADGCTGNRIVGNEITDLGAGGIKLNGSAAEGSRAGRTGNNEITDNHIHDGGHVFHAATGIIAKHTFGNVIAHNHIHDLFYSGISCGWVWGYAENVARDNRIENNHIHDLGFGWLSDMGGIYTLGVQPGTVIRGNFIHDIRAATYGGWGIYLDEGSSHILVENNICARFTSQPFHVHFGRENIVRNNVFAFGGASVIALSRVEDHNAFTLERNILLTDTAPIYKGGYRASLNAPKFLADLNLLWSTAGVLVIGKNRDAEPAPDSFTAWQTQIRQDIHSIIADPQFADAARFDFTILNDSPALLLGFRPIPNCCHPEQSEGSLSISDTHEQQHSTSPEIVRDVSLRST